MKIENYFNAKNSLDFFFFHIILIKFVSLNAEIFPEFFDAVWRILHVILFISYMSESFAHNVELFSPVSLVDKECL